MCSIETRTIKSSDDSFLDDILNGLLHKFALPAEKRLFKENDKIIFSIFQLTEEARGRSADVFKSIDGILNNNRSHDDRDRSFFSVIEGMFYDSISWGKIIVAFGFMVEVLMRTKMYPNIYDEYYEMSKTVLTQYMNPWVTKNGGWVYFETVNICQESVDSSETVVKNVGKVVLVAAGFWALGKWMSG